METRPRVSIVQDLDFEVRVLTCFNGRPGSFVSNPVQSEEKHGKERAACRAVIAWAKRECLCVDAEVFHIRRRHGETRVTIVSICGSGQRVKRTGLASQVDHCLAAAQACLSAVLLLPAPDPHYTGIRVRL